MPEIMDLSCLQGKGIQPGEEILPDDQAEKTSVEIDENTVAQLVDMGFTVEGCRRAVFNTGNSGVEAAMAWVMDHMSDPDFNDPFTTGPSTGGGTKKCTAGEEVIGMVMSMGFTREQAEMALRNTDNNLERAVEWIFSHPDGEDPPSGEESDIGQDLTNGDPRLVLLLPYNIMIGSH